MMKDLIPNSDLLILCLQLFKKNKNNKKATKNMIKREKNNTCTQSVEWQWEKKKTKQKTMNLTF